MEENTQSLQEYINQLETTAFPLSNEFFHTVLTELNTKTQLIETLEERITNLESTINTLEASITNDFKAIRDVIAGYHE